MQDRDAIDPAPLRDRFATTATAYMAGNSLGLMPREAPAAIARRLDEWRELAVEGWCDAGWLDDAATLAGPLARLVGAREDEVVAMNTLTVDLHLLLAALYRPTRERFRIVVDADAFPSDLHAVASHLAWHGLDPAEAMVLDPDAIDERTAVVLLAGVSYLTGEAADIPRRTREAHAAGALAVWDLAHAAGNLPLALADWGVDAAAWCGYKYLCGGPGAPAAAFVHRRHHDAPRLAGWWGVDPATRFRMEPGFVPRAGAGGFALSTPPILGLAPLGVAVRLLDEAGMPALRARSERLTAHLAARLAAIDGVAQITPDDPARRGCQLSVRVADARARCGRLRAEHDVVCDFREPDVIRLAPVPAITTYAECDRAADALAAVLAR